MKFPTRFFPPRPEKDVLKKLMIDTRFNHGRTLSSGYWLKSGILYPLSCTHIRAVLDDPQLFNRKKTNLISVFRKYHEKIGLEGKARSEIINALLREGWIRIRHYTAAKDYWAVHCVNPKLQKSEIEAFITTARSAGAVDEDSLILINGKQYV